MPPYDPCWCGSDKKWKWCHKDREKRTPIKIGRLLYEMREKYSLGYCCHPDAGTHSCSQKIIRAHTIQRKGGLAEVAEDGHVMSVKAGVEAIFDNEGRIDPILDGVRGASTFNGFCNHHDTTLFRPIENCSSSLSAESIFLLAFRAIAYELYTKRAALQAVPIQQQMDFGAPFEIQAAIQQHLHYNAVGMKRGLAELESLKNCYDSAYHRKDFSDFSVYAVEFSKILPVVASGAFYPEVDFYGNQLQKLGRGSAEFQQIAFNLTTLNGTTVAAFGWLGRKDGPPAAFVESFKNLSDSEKSTAVIQLAFEQLENTYMRPSWWLGLPEEWRNYAILKIKSGTGLAGIRGVEALSSRPYQFSEVGIRSDFYS
ncbi:MULTISPECIES: zinc chelation protein SecC [Pseudomonas]|uniref:zinc chelation protein SecC n=1 Tax=Pseudomonas TaxID=286 RepID=UPI0012D77D89|nr:zinc chelation protein SecC [Pseudomonas monteilii]